MARPTNKSELLAAATTQFDKMWALMERLPPDTAFTFSITEKDKEAHWQRDKNLRDILIHLYEWHQLTLNWLAANRNQNQQHPVPFLPAPYSWKNYGAMNIGFWEKHQGTTYETARQQLLNSHEAVLQAIASFTDEELFTKAYFKWSGTTSVGSYLVSSTSSHYAWAAKKVKRQLKESA